ncbi:hypothetical protein FHL15_005092 [Xylaria flabelliformis]|uniref:Uncharacterized protein n=1 Tax=Xylaria flabelliformis TaxID=2512241 RepID=A0A553I1E1_9PEZI|nr:hypothetical protein FHL15_005092 [Xylaria flabelliformis]
MSSAVPSRQADYPMTEAISDSANDGVSPLINFYDIPEYDSTKDADAVPKYTREYLQRLSTVIDGRLRNLDSTTTYYPDALIQTRKVHRCLMGLLIVLGLLWLAIAIIVIVIIFKGRGSG